MTGRLYAFGEVLWDVFPDAEVPGGAPMNVALHAHQLGISAHIISALGHDARGEKMRNWLHSRGVVTTSIATVENLPTGTVAVDLNDPKNVRYRIESPVAWDKIPIFPAGVGQDDVVVFGSLSCRTDDNWSLLKQNLPGAGLRVLDLNLRAPFYAPGRVQALLENCDLLKVNEEEFDELLSWFPAAGEIDDVVREWMKRFGFSQLCLTRGERGAFFFTEDARYESRNFAVDVVDTIGSGDSFLAALLAGRMLNHPIQQCLDEAAALGALVAASKGANPPVNWGQIRAMVTAQSQSALA